jgi:hypothetical protein
VREKNARRAGLVVVELREERAQHLVRAERAVGLGEVRAVAPVLAGAEEKHLDAVKSALLMDGEHVGLFHSARVDALCRLHGRERSEPIAIDRSALKIECRGGALHLAAELVAHSLAFAG